MEKQAYIKPEIDKIRIDNEISVVLMSSTASPAGDPPGLPPPPDQE